MLDKNDLHVSLPAFACASDSVVRPGQMPFDAVHNSRSHTQSRLVDPPGELGRIAEELARVLSQVSPEEARTLLGRLWQRERRVRRRSTNSKAAPPPTSSAQSNPARWASLSSHPTSFSPPHLELQRLIFRMFQWAGARFGFTAVCMPRPRGSNDPWFPCAGTHSESQQGTHCTFHVSALSWCGHSGFTSSRF